jgi:hypothetical protein
VSGSSRHLFSDFFVVVGRFPDNSNYSFSKILIPQNLLIRRQLSDERKSYDNHNL